MATYTMKNKGNGISVTSAEHTLKECWGMVKRHKKFDKKKQIEFTVNDEKEVKEVGEKILKITSEIELLEAGTKTKLTNKKTDNFTWEIYHLKSSLKESGNFSRSNARSDNRMKNW